MTPNQLVVQSPPGQKLTDPYYLCIAYIINYIHIIVLQEYLPILNKYKSMPEDYMKFTIDKNLKKFEAALNHIAKYEIIINNLALFFLIKSFGRY